MSKERLLEELKKVIDPHTGMDIVSMGLVKSLDEREGKVRITIKPTSPFCPVGEYLLKAVKDIITSIGYEADVKLEDYAFGEDAHED
ncbi:MAG: iron-sulfur cluster assembly protein [Hydrogenobacter thermophilus]|uniref:metal-sulfur cluster assembly factor n=1 Tax=Hydrogenobacter thermophilus TaxID=940 RepID=UPI001C76AD75|nr:iron-sulfur cluster assembly protein [Hydrogenobacter thermophilus]MCS7285126.1 iron-sulfur cluster assembly protein [Hydrogenobacter thermophilus]QWK19941.1 MAG: DUF59 domain-containing protein [Hydrogenobacter thermophilus]